MCGKLFTAVVVIVAVILAALASLLPPEHLDYVIGISRFFDIMLPVLAVGGLIKYLMCGSKSCCPGCGKSAGECVCCSKR